MSGRDHKARGLAPPHEAMNPQPSKERDSEVGRPSGVWARSSALEPLQQPLLAMYLFAFLPSAPDGKPGKVAQWNIVPHLLDHCLLPPFCPIHPFLPSLLPCSLG